MSTGDHFDHDHDRDLNEKQLLHKIVGLLQQLINVTITGDEAIIVALQLKSTLPTAVQITQTDRKGASQMAITGTNAGGSSTFEADAILNGAADPDGFPAGSVDTWTTDDVLVSLGPDSGPNNSQVVASVGASDTASDYGLTVSVQMPAVGGVSPAPLVMSIRVPIVQSAPPVPNAVAINQVS